MAEVKEIIDSVSIRSRAVAQAAEPGSHALQIVVTTLKVVDDQGVALTIATSGAGGSLLFATVQGSDTGASALSVPGAQVGATVLIAIDLTGVVDLLGGGYVESTVTVAGQVQQLLAYAGAASVNLPLLVVNP